MGSDGDSEYFHVWIMHPFYLCCVQQSQLFGDCYNHPITAVLLVMVRIFQFLSHLLLVVCSSFLPFMNRISMTLGPRSALLVKGLSYLLIYLFFLPYVCVVFQANSLTSPHPCSFLVSPWIKPGKGGEYLTFMTQLR